MSYGKSQESIKFAVLKQEKDSSNRNKELKEQQKNTSSSILPSSLMHTIALSDKCGKENQPSSCFLSPTYHCSVWHAKQAPVGVETLLWVSTKFHDPNDVTSRAATALAEHYHNSPTSWAFPDYLDLTSQRENDFKDWISRLHVSKIQQLEATDSPSLFSTCTIMPGNEAEFP